MSGDLTARDDLVQQLAMVLARDAYPGPLWLDLSSEMREAEVEGFLDTARAVLARRDLVIPAADVLRLADDIWRGPSAYTVATIGRELRILAQQGPVVEQGGPGAHAD